ncbi:hypothetical protein [Streptomyces sp. NPDC006134]|uniref:hypothetical protein n=1 Tax=Streptomyces sp. NPDC006134 TaxID=3154467 RepID=UPI0033DCBBE9
MPQVAGSALAAVVAAKLASSFGVYGTILGAGVVSVIATCGGTLFQHFFKRTGEQLRGAAVIARHQERPRGHTPPAPGEFTEGTVYRARVKSWKRPVIAAALVFGVTMAGITAYELASGHSLSGGSSTTVGGALSGHAKPAADHGDSGDSGEQGGSGDSEDSKDPKDTGDSRNSPDSGTSQTPGAGDAPTGGPSGTPDGGTGAGTPPSAAPSQGGGAGDGATPAPSPTGSQGAGDTPGPSPSGPATAPEPSADGRSGTGDPGRDGPAAP